MIYLVEYDRARGSLNLTPFPDSERRRAEDERLTLELRLNRMGVSREVVLLEAPSEDALRITHRRYFEDLVELTKSSASTTRG